MRRLPDHGAVHVAGQPAEAVPDGLHLRARRVGCLRDRRRASSTSAWRWRLASSATCMRSAGVPVLPMVLGVVLGFMVESNYRRALVLSDGDHMTFVQDPARAGTAARGAAVVAGSLVRHAMARHATDRGGGMSQTGVSASERLAAWLADGRRRAAAAARCGRGASGSSSTSPGCAWRRAASPTSTATLGGRRPRRPVHGDRPRRAASTRSAPRSSTARPRTARTTTTPSKADPCIPARSIVPAVLAACEREGLAGDARCWLASPPASSCCAD